MHFYSTQKYVTTNVDLQNGDIFGKLSDHMMQLRRSRVHIPEEASTFHQLFVKPLYELENCDE